MIDKDKIATYYSNARELVKQNNPKAARAYVLAILNCALETYQKATKILTKAKTQAFLDQWIKVSRELYDKGVTDFVLGCFGLPVKQDCQVPKTKADSAQQPSKSSSSQGKPDTSSVDEVDIAGLVEECAKTQGWCAEQFDKNKRAVVEISASNSQKNSTGTGFIISSKGYLLTNDHIVYDEDAQGYYPKTKMSLAGGKTVKINVLFSDKKSDVALCSFDPNSAGNFSVIKRISDYSRVLQGADCLVIGNAFGMGLAPFSGVVRFTKNAEGNLVYTAPSNPGDSGGPVLNRNGECIGINKSKTLTVDNVSADGYVNATPMDKIEELLYKWCDANNIEL